MSPAFASSPEGRSQNRQIGDSKAPDAPALAHITDDFDRDVWCVMGLPIDRLTLPEAVIAIETAIRDRRRLSFVTPNVNWLVRALKDPQARRQVIESDLSLADGTPLIAMARILGVPLTGRAAGADLFEALRRRPGFPGRRIGVFFFGGRDGSAIAAAQAVRDERGGLDSAGWLNPGHGDLDSMSGAEVVEKINAAAADFLVVALGAAKGQNWIDRNQSLLNVPVIAHLGAVVDFTAGALRRAPPTVGRLGFEWLWRIGQDPALWRRYASDSFHLLGFCLTRLIPQLSLGRGRRANRPGTVEIQRSASGTELRLTGDFAAGKLQSARDAFRIAAAAGSDAVLDFSSVDRIDRSFLGLMLVLEKALLSRGATIRVAGMNKKQRLLFTRNAMNYPEASAAPAEMRIGRVDAR